MKGYIYHITNNKNNKKYIGLTTEIHKRFSSHKTMLKSNSHHSKKLQNDYNTYGMSAFNFSYIEYDLDDINVLCKLEKEEILKYDSFINGYNGNPGGASYIPRIHRLKDEDALDILFSINNFKNKTKILADYYDVDRHTISGIKQMTGWMHVRKKYENLSKQEFNKLKEKVIEKYNFSEEDFCKDFEHKNKRKLNKEECLAICSIAKHHKSIGKSIAEALNISHTSIHRIIRGETYKEFYQAFKKLDDEQTRDISEYFYDEWNLEEIFNKRDAHQLKNGKRLTQDEICYVGCAREFLQITYQKIADKFGYNESSIRDMYKGRSYVEKMNYYNSLSENERKSYINDTNIFFNL